MRRMPWPDRIIWALTLLAFAATIARLAWLFTQ